MLPGLWKVSSAVMSSQLSADGGAMGRIFYDLGFGITPYAATTCLFVYFVVGLISMGEARAV